MSDSHVIARKFRPKSFDQVVGQEAITRTLGNAIKTNRLHHAYLFAGARGVGKTTTARILAKALNCASGPTVEPCGKCASCLDIAAASSIDVLEIDAASNTGVDNVRDVIINTVAIAPAQGRFKIFIIDEVHMLSNQAFNALLKTLEEPPPHVKFIMATTELHKVPETILSRCQVFEFRTISLKKIFEQLRAIAANLNVTISDSALLAIARAGDGSMRDAESALDQVISFAGEKVTDDDVSAALGLVDIETLNTAARAIAEQDAQQLLRIVEEVVSRGYDLRNFCREMMTHFRSLLVVKISGLDYEILQLPQSEGETLARLADSFSDQDLVRFFSILSRTEQDIRTSSQPRFHLEIGLMKLVHARRLYQLEEALSRISDIESRLTGGAALAPAESGNKKPEPRDSVKPVQQTSTVRSFQRPQRDAIEPPPRPIAQPRAVPPIERQTKPDDQINADSPFQPSRTQFKPPASKMNRATSSQPFEEPPPLLDEPYEIEQDLPRKTAAQKTAALKPAAPPPEPIEDGAIIGDKIKRALEARNKMILSTTLDTAESIEVDGDTLRICFAPSDGLSKSKFDNRDNRQMMDEVCREVFGRRMSLSVSAGAQPKTQSGQSQNKQSQNDQAQSSLKPDDANQREAPGIKEQAGKHPAVRALVDKFHGEILDVIKPES